MRQFSAQYIFTNNGPALLRGIITTEDDGTIVSISDSHGNLEEKESTEFYNGVIIPGFVNCHCHLELSHLKGIIPEGIGLAAFIEQVRNTRNINENIISYISSADKEMDQEGIVLCADICNNAASFRIKEESVIRYSNLLEVFGIDPTKAEHRLDEVLKIADIARGLNLTFSMVPHSVYSMSLSLFRLLKKENDKNRITSIHFMESEGEKSFLETHSGPLMNSFKNSGLIPSRLETVNNHADAILKEVVITGNLLLVHNTFADRETIKLVKERKDLYWCLCPNSNLYIENKIPPLNLLLEEECEIVIGTDSLASNNKLSILEEIKTLQKYFPELSLAELVRWATLNGAKALNEEDRYGKIETGRKPGLLLIQNVDLGNLKLLPESFVTKLI